MVSFGNIPAERLAIESTYEGLCTVSEMKDLKDPVNPRNTTAAYHYLG